MSGSAGVDGVTPEQPRAALAGAIAGLDGLGRERPLVEGHQQRFDARSQRFDRGVRREGPERREFRPADPGNLRADA